MYPVTNAVKALFDAEQRQVLRITGTDKNGNAINITEANVMEGGFNIDRYACNGSKLEIGTAIASEMTVRLDNRLGQFDNITFEGAELFVEDGIADWSQDNPTITYIPCGYFTPDEQPRRLSTINLNALDRMTRFDVILPAMLPWTDNLGNEITDNSNNIIYFAAAIEFPATIESLIRQLCTICSVPLGTDLTTMPGYDYVITGMPDSQGEITARNLIQWCAGIMASNAWIDWEGKLRFSWYNNTTGYTTTAANRFDHDMFENDVVITGVKWVDTDSDNTVYLAGTDQYVLDMSDNQLIDSGIVSTVLNDVYDVVHSFAYRPFKATVVPAPYLWPMDRVTFTDKNGSGHVSILTNVNFTINGSSVIAANGESVQTNGMAVPSGFTSEQLSVLRKLRRTNATDLNNAIDTATKLITGADGGFVRFIYDENDVLSEIVIMDTDDIATATQVWRWNQGGLGYSSNGYAGPYTLAMTQDGAIVADFITAGTMSANVMRAGILTDITGTNIWDLDNGIFRLAGNATLDGRPITQLISDIDATISSVEIQFAQNDSQVVAPTDGWSTSAPSWAAGYYIWQRTVTTTPSGVSYSEPTCISGRDGSESTPGLNQATIYLYQRSETAPSAPDANAIYTFVNGTLAPLPSGWTRNIPSGSDPCWVITASAISTDTQDVIEPSDWSTPVMAFENGEDGAKGADVESVVDYYAISSTTEPPADTEFWTPGVPVLWMDNYGNVITAGSSGNIEFMPPAVPVPTLIDPYVWTYQLTTYTDGTTSRTNKHLSAILGDAGVGISDLTVEYYLSASNTEQIFGEWTTEQPQWMLGYFIWTRTVITWTDNKVTTTDPVLAQSINLANETAYDAVSRANQAIDNTSNLDASLNQVGIFNRLTNNGDVKGIFLENNQLYMNADYINSGTIDADLIAANSLTISQLDGDARSAIVSGVTAKTQYYLSTSSSSASGGEWTDAMPTWTNGKYVWTRSVTTKTYADGTTVVTNGDGVYDGNLTTALSTATSASSAASAAQSTADGAASAASTAQTTANNAVSAAGTAQTTANNAASAASAAQSSANAAQSTADSAVSAASAAQSTANSAVSAAAAAQSSANSAVASTVSVFYRSTTNTTPTISTSTSIGTAADTSNVWTYVMPRPKNGCYFYTCERYLHVDNSVTFSTVRSIANANYTSMWCSANDATYIDGAHIYAGSVTAEQIAAGTLTVTELSGATQKALATSSTSKTQYYLSDSSASATGGTWQDTVPATWTNGKYIWTRVATTTTKADGTTSTVYSAGVYDWNATYALMSSASANTAAQNAQSTANSAASTVTSKTQYYLSTSNSSATGGSWQDSVPAWISGRYLWSRVATTTTPISGNATTTYSNGVYEANLTSALNSAAAANAAAADAQSTADGAVGSASAKTQYYLSSSSTSATGGEWTDTMPTWTSGKYVWTRVAMTTTSVSGTSSTTHSTGIYDRNLTSALITASLASTTADGAVYREQTIYRSVSSATSSQAAVTTWVINTSGNQNVWTTTRPTYSANYPVLFTALQRQTMAQSSGTACSCTAPVVDQTTTVIDGGHITTGTIDAGVVDVTNLNASNITGGTIDGTNVNAKLINIVDASNNVLASFKDVITIGQTTETHVTIDSNSFELYDENNVMFLSMGDFRNSQGTASLSQTFYCDGQTRTFTTSCTPSTVTSVAIDGVTTTNYTRIGKRFTLNTYPSNGSIVTIVYVTRDPVYHYDLGIRNENGTLGYGSVAEGQGPTASGLYSHAEGQWCTASGEVSHAEGTNNIASAWASHAEGGITVASGRFSHAEGGFGTTASGWQSHAEGSGTTASGDSCHAEGLDTTASGSECHAEGYGSIANGIYGNHAEGYYTSTNNDGGYTNGYGSHAEGAHTQANGSYGCHAEGWYTVSSAIASHAEGEFTTAASECQHVVGSSNIPDSSKRYIEIVGNGDHYNSSYSNARTLDWSGNEWISGRLTQASDERLKTESGDIPDVAAIPAHRFKWNDEKHNHDDLDHIGYFAQDVEKVAPYLVSEDAMGYKSLDYIGFLVAKIASLEKRVAELESARN